jgi:hypothetical protein
LEKFKKLRKRLIEKGLINDPDTRRKKLPRTVSIDYEPPTIDSAQETFAQEADSRKGKKSKVKRTRMRDGSEVLSVENNESDDQGE